MNARTLLLFSAPVTLIVIVFGAFVRLSDAGLGCPDWPGCYGQLLGVADAQTAAANYPGSDYDIKKAWIEVSHRYIAGLLGILLLAAAVLDWLQRRRYTMVPLVLLVIVQALLGMLTVTEKLKPAIVTSHLVFGMLILALISAAITRRPLSVALSAAERKGLLFLWAEAAVILAIQIALGGWVSSNYAGLACPDFPLCHGEVIPLQLDFSAFSPLRELFAGADGEPITAAALVTIHWAHRFLALMVLITFAGFIVMLIKYGARGEAIGLSVFLLLQISLGIVNVIWQLPLWAAVAHNAFAALLVINIAVLGVKLTRS